mmetsp:Transcript_31246/g.57147  ORF Transcript_31246/g.57147 Transcript_31246/m.57147 type:complete len:813 (-) Transcript_31246:307-2745(-)
MDLGSQLPFRVHGMSLLGRGPCNLGQDVMPSSSSEITVITRPERLQRRRLCWPKPAEIAVAAGLAVGYSASRSCSSGSRAAGNTPVTVCAHARMKEEQARPQRRSVAVLGQESHAKALVRNTLLQDLPNKASDEPTWATKVWCSCTSPLTLLEAPAHVDFLPFVDIALRVCASSLMVIPFAPSKSGDQAGPSMPEGAEMAAHWVRRVEAARRPLSIVLCASASDQQHTSLKAANDAFFKALQDVRLLGLRPVVLSAPADSNGSWTCQSVLGSNSGPSSMYWNEMLNAIGWRKRRQPTSNEVLDALKARCARLELVPVVCMTEADLQKESQATLHRSGRDVLQDLVAKVLPGLGDIVDGMEAGCWQGVHPISGKSESVRPVSNEPFAGIAFQTTYLENGACKAYDMLVVRGTLRPGQLIFNATTGSDSIIQVPDLQPGGGCCGKVEIAFPGDVVRVTLPAVDVHPGTGGLCSWCDPDSSVRLPVLHEEAYALLAGGHCSHTVQLGGPQEERLLGALMRSIEEDQSLRLEFGVSGSRVRLTSQGVEQLRRLRARLARLWGVDLALEREKLTYGSSLKCEVEVETTSRHDHQVVGRIVPLPAGSGVKGFVQRSALRQPRSIPLDEASEAFTKGVQEACRDGIQLATGRFPLADLQVELLSVDSTAASAQQLHVAGSRLVQNFAAGASLRSSAGLVHGTTDIQAHLAQSALVLLEPLAEINVQVPTSHADKVLQHLYVNGATIRGVQLVRPMLASVKARIAHRRLQGYGDRLAKLTQSTGTFATQSCGHTPILETDITGIAAAMLDNSTMRSWSNG